MAKKSNPAADQPKATEAVNSPSKQEAGPVKPWPAPDPLTPAEIEALRADMREGLEWGRQRLRENPHLIP